MSFVHDHLAVAMASHAAKAAKAAAEPSRFTRGFATIVASIAFTIKKLRMPLCDFQIDEQGIRRTAAGKEVNVPWSDVVAVHRYSQGFIVDRQQGSMPLPFRCFTADQLRSFENLITTAGVTRSG